MTRSQASPSPALKRALGPNNPIPAAVRDVENWFLHALETYSERCRKLAKKHRLEWEKVAADRPLFPDDPDRQLQALNRLVELSPDLNLQPPLSKNLDPVKLAGAVMKLMADLEDGYLLSESNNS